MLSFRCPRCEQVVIFENTSCLRCGLPLGFDAQRRTLVAAEGAAPCANASLVGCNWLVPSPGQLCLSCRLTRTRPADTDAPGTAAFIRAESDKRRLVFQLLDLGLTVESWEDVEQGLAYDLLSSREQDVITGHEDGVVTIDLAESDNPHREQIRLEMGEPYRTMLGHLRHETGHYYWPVLVERTGRGGDFRALFGDESLDYGEAMDRHYSHGAPAGWEESYVSAYATMHPWEDWAETFAHYLHIRDTLQTAAAYGMRLDRREEELSAEPSVHVDGSPFADMLADWLPLTYALNAVNRSMGHGDLYPFVLSPTAVEKLTWVHRLAVAR